MDFIDKIKDIAERAKSLGDKLQTEEATKNALIMPFISALEYDVFNPIEVVPEYTADVGVKKGEKVDYAIIKDNKPIILIECKKIEDEKLEAKKHATQLFRYFTATDAKFIILTNGIIYKFFSDIEENGKLDNEPFFTFNLLNFKEKQISQLQAFSKGSFDIEKAYANASDLKYITQFVDVLFEEYNNPNQEFVKYLINRSGICQGRITPQIIEKHTKTTIEAFNSFISKIMKNVLDGSISLNTVKQNDKEDKKNEVITTIDELEGYAIVKSILKGTINIKRVTYRDNASYFNVLLDDNIRKTICRLYFNRSQKYISFVDDNKEQKEPISSVDDIFNFADRICERAKYIDTTIPLKK
ncbi:MAG: type I restriction enzyme HsdR N-terminal domain-containing protein [Candidatus Gastranaerophilales bacterium]|nr:type I restriction enzyme HsdR N-terminal domain-containing protein [Candidatus Gastranaerophilales bacterium]